MRLLSLSKVLDYLWLASLAAKLLDLDRLVNGGTAVCVQRAEQRGKNKALRKTGAVGPGLKDLFSQLHMLLPVCQEVCDTPVGKVGHR